MDFQYKTIYENKLSDCLVSGKDVSKFVKLVIGSKITKNPSTTYSFNRLEIRSTLKGNPSIGVSLNFSDFQWFVECIEKKKEYSIHGDKKTLIFNDMNDTSVSICNVDSDRIFGVVLTKNDVNKIIEESHFFLFFLKNQNLAGIELVDLTKKLFIYVLLKEFDLEYPKGFGWQNENLERFERTLLEKIFSGNDFDIAMAHKFDKLMTFLNVKAADRLVQVTKTIPEFKEKTDEILALAHKLAYEKEENKVFDEIFSIV